MLGESDFVSLSNRLYCLFNFSTQLAWGWRKRRIIGFGKHKIKFETICVCRTKDEKSEAL